MKNFIKLVSPYFFGDEGRYARWGGIALLFLSQLNTLVGYLFIQWNRRFYDALENLNSTLFLRESLIFIFLAIAYVTVISFMRYYGQQYALRWRLWMTRTVLKIWLAAENRGIVEGSDQRIQEDLMRFTIIFERFFLEAFNSILTIICFTPLLFIQTKNVYIGNFPVGICLLIIIVTYTLIGMFVSAKIANPLIQIEYDNQKVEAEFRYNLVHARDGQNQKTEFFNSLLDKINLNYNQMYSKQKQFNFWQQSYDQFSFLIPFALLATNYFAGLITFGMLMQVKATVSRVRNSMSYILDNYTSFTEMLAITKRVTEFYESNDIKFALQKATNTKVELQANLS